MDKKLESRIARLEKMLSRKNEAFSDPQQGLSYLDFSISKLGEVLNKACSDAADLIDQADDLGSLVNKSDYDILNKTYDSLVKIRESLRDVTIV